jgi:glycosyltransferase involved in cell wall biosynthesis
MSASTPTFSVIIPTYGRARFLEEAVGSVLRQTVSDLECIVVDDASQTPVELEDDPRIRVIYRPENGGPAAARNSGLAEAKGKFITFLDDDDVYAPDRLAIAAEGLGHAPVAICWSRTLDPNAPGGGRMLMGDVRDSILDATTPHLGATAVRREVVQPFDERFVAAQDVEWWLRMSALATVWTVPRVGLFYRRHDGARHRNGTPARVQASLDLLDMERDYFRVHPKARAFRWMRIGLMAMDEGDLRLARRALWRSCRAHPTARSAWHLVQAATPRAATDRQTPDQETVPRHE